MTSQRRIIHRTAQSLAAGAVFLVIAGCGSSGPPTVPVTGVVTIDGQPPGKPGTIYFAPVAPSGDLPRRPTTGEFDAEGRFTAKAFKDSEGLIPGEYRLGFECWETPPRPSGPPPKSLIAPHYGTAETSGFELVVPPDSPKIEIDFDLSSE